MTFCMCLGFLDRNQHFLICFPMNYRDFSVKSKEVFSLFQTVKLRLSIFTVSKFVLHVSPIKYHLCSFFFDAN